MLKLYYSPNLNPRVAVAVAKYLGSPVQYIRARPFHPAHMEAFRKINPNTRVPVLVEDNRTLWETDAIACRLSELAGVDFWRTGVDSPEMVMWISWGTHHLTRAADPVYFERIVRPQFSDKVMDPAELEEPLREFRQHAAILDAYLADHEWLVGNHISYADFRVATSLPFAERAGLPLDGFANILRWHGKLMAFPAWNTPFEGLEM
jgi:glutathione S-transferase